MTRYDDHVVRTRWLGIAAWIVPAALSTLQTYTEESPLNCGGSWWRAGLREATPWLVWAAATPLILAWARRPDALRRWPRHLLAIAVIGLVFGTLGGVLSQVARATPSTMTTAAAIEMGIIDWFPIQPVIYAGVLAAGIALETAHRRREAELALATARLAALRNQIQPHFLFNTLNAAVALARANDVEGCTRVLVLLGELLHELLRADAPHEVALRDELELVSKYLEIQRVRFGERLRVTWQIEDAARAVLVPQLVLQPLVENAFRHGLSQRAAAGALEITAAHRDDALELSVRDDGPGPGERVAFGVGLANTRDRLRALHGEASSLTLAREEGGARATITLPWRT